MTYSVTTQYFIFAHGFLAELPFSHLAWFSRKVTILVFDMVFFSKVAIFAFDMDFLQIYHFRI